MQNKYVETIEVEKNGNYYIVHNLGTKDILWTVYEESTGQDAGPAFRVVDKNTINVTFDSINEGSYRIVIRS